MRHWATHRTVRQKQKGRSSQANAASEPGGQRGLEASRASLRVVSLGMLVLIPAEMWFVAVTGTGDTRAAFAIEVVLTTAMLAASYLSAFVLELELEFVWMSLPLASLACLALSYTWVRVGYWRRIEL